MEKKELKKANGDVFFEAMRAADNSYILVNWVGIQSLETIMLGANQLLQMLRHQPSLSILNSNKELIGPWDDGALFLGNTWAVKASILGVKNFAHVLAPGLYGKRSFQKFEQFAERYFTIETFESEVEAIQWLEG
ncbi:hypothetical protein I5M27_06950 [Adhaeribacter sp. BT258]|uniref:STAS/SEC14 domain-containing protein n=1 Tax=Adhaeribacter terrigena TaxID=2793070 RepID=A0ABS1BZX2_9BACT|nr:hypothetical protein [Adhaeribacter terrigena]MBK0402717.1 hypothetical protein [Adhaeribacter terrigena]